MHREFIPKLLIQIHTSGFVLGLINLISVFPFSMSKILALKNTSIISHLLWPRIHTRVSNLQSAPCERSQAQKRECHHQRYQCHQGWDSTVLLGQGTGL